jgi:hypothetical protein
MPAPRAWVDGVMTARPNVGTSERGHVRTWALLNVGGSERRRVRVRLYSTGDARGSPVGATYL